MIMWSCEYWCIHLILTGSVGGEIPIHSKGTLNWSIGHYLSLNFWHSWRYRIDSFSIMLVLLKSWVITLYTRWVKAVQIIWLSPTWFTSGSTGWSPCLSRAVRIRTRFMMVTMWQGVRHTARLRAILTTSNYSMWSPILPKLIIPMGSYQYNTFAYHAAPRYPPPQL